MPLSSLEFGDITHQQLKTGHGGSNDLPHGNQHTLQISTTVLNHPPTPSPLLTIYQDTTEWALLYSIKSRPLLLMLP